MDKKVLILNLPNFLSLIRLILTFVFAILLFYSFKYWALSVFILALFTDLLDGYLARKFKQVTLLGKILDPAADRLLALLTFLILLFKYNLPTGLAVLAISYHLIIVFGWVIAWQIKGVALAHNFWGKSNSFLQACLVFSVVLNFFPQVFFAIVTVSLLTAFTNYLIDFLKVWGRKLA